MKENMVFTKSIVEVIRDRRSVRNYKPMSLENETKDKLIQYMKGLQSPFNSGVRLELVEESSIVETSGGRVGTYGFIKGATTYIAAIIEEKEGNLEEIGFMLEKLILYATSLGLGTCWLGGTFNRGQFAEHLKLRPTECLPIVTPIGYPMDKMSMMEKAIRFAAGSNNRKPWRELFFNNTFKTPLAEAEAEKYAIPLEMIRLSPSASNKQPWRVVKANKQWLFYLKATKGYGEGLGYNIQRVDVGIAMCHFEMTLKELGLTGEWVVKEDNNINKPEAIKYIITWLES